MWNVKLAPVYCLARYPRNIRSSFSFFRSDVGDGADVSVCAGSGVCVDVVTVVWGGVGTCVDVGVGVETEVDAGDDPIAVVIVRSSFPDGFE
jgi:hypothetical protein